MIEYKISKKQSEVYHLRTYSGFDWANIYVNEIGPQSGELVINSDFGNWAYVWHNCGMFFKDFLIKAGKEYLTKKLNGSTKKNIDWDKTKEQILKDVNDHNDFMIEEKKFTKEQSKKFLEAWHDFFNDEWEEENLFYKLLRDDYSNEFGELYGHDYEAIPVIKEYEVGIRCFMSQIWPVFVEQLKNEMNVTVNTGG